MFVNDPDLVFSSREVSFPPQPKSARYHSYIGSDKRTWLIGENMDPESIYCTQFPDPEKRGSGFGGSDTLLPLVDGSTFVLKGGWSCNSNDFYEQTGIDVRSNHPTVVCIGRELLPLEGNDCYGVRLGDLLYMETEPKIGLLQRGEIILNDYLREHPREALFLCVVGRHGSSRSAKRSIDDVTASYKDETDLAKTLNYLYQREYRNMPPFLRETIRPWFYSNRAEITKEIIASRKRSTWGGGRDKHQYTPKGIFEKHYERFLCRGLADALRQELISLPNLGSLRRPKIESWSQLVEFLIHEPERAKEHSPRLNAPAIQSLRIWVSSWHQDFQQKDLKHAS